MAYKHSKRCSVCVRIRQEIGDSHRGRAISRLWRYIEDHHLGKMSLPQIVEQYPDIAERSLANHKNFHQMLTAEDVATSQVKALQRKSDTEKINIILKSALKADDMRSMMKEMFQEIMDDEVKRANFMKKFTPSVAAKMINDEEALELKKVDSAHEIVKTMNAFASGGLSINLPTPKESDYIVEGDVVEDLNADN